MTSVATVDGVRIPYENVGRGPGLILVHGTGPGADITFGHLLGELQKSFTVVMPDLSGTPAVDDGGVELTVEHISLDRRGRTAPRQRVRALVLP